MVTRENWADIGPLLRSLITYRPQAPAGKGLESSRSNTRRPLIQPVSWLPSARNTTSFSSLGWTSGLTREGSRSVALFCCHLVKPKLPSLAIHRAYMLTCPSAVVDQRPITPARPAPASCTVAWTSPVPRGWKPSGERANGWPLAVVIVYCPLPSRVVPALPGPMYQIPPAPREKSFCTIGWYGPGFKVGVGLGVGVNVGDIGVLVGGTGVLVGVGVCVGRGVLVGVRVRVGGIGVLVGARVLVGGIGVYVGTSV